MNYPVVKVDDSTAERWRFIGGHNKPIGPIRGSGQPSILSRWYIKHGWLKCHSPSGTYWLDTLPLFSHCQEHVIFPAVLVRGYGHPARAERRGRGEAVSDCDGFFLDVSPSACWYLKHQQYVGMTAWYCGMEEILHHLGCTKPSKQWDKLPNSTGAEFLPSTVSSYLVKLQQRHTTSPQKVANEGKSPP